MYRVEVECRQWSRELGEHKTWKPVSPTGSDEPYEWQTEREAEMMRKLCYDVYPWTARVVKVTP